MKARTFWLVVFLVVTFSVGGAGCGMTSQERIDKAEQALSIVAEVSETIEGQIGQIQAGIATIQATLADPNMAADSKASLDAALAKGVEELTRLQEQKARIDATVAKVRAVIAAGPDSGADISDELRLLGQSLVAAGGAVPGEIGLWLKLAGGALVVLAGMIAAWARGKVATATTALKEVVAGGEIFKGRIEAGQSGATAAAIVETFRGAHNKGQEHEATRLLVAKLQKELVAEQAA